MPSLHTGPYRLSPAGLQHLLHTHHQGQHIEGLRDIVVRAAPEALHLVLRVRHGRQADHRKAPLPQLGQQCKSVHARKHHVQQRQVVVTVFPKGIAGRKTVVKGGHLILRAFQIQLQRLRNGVVILDEQNSVSHSIHPLPFS